MTFVFAAVHSDSRHQGDNSTEETTLIRYCFSQQTPGGKQCQQRRREKERKEEKIAHSETWWSIHYASCRLKYFFSSFHWMNMKFHSHRSSVTSGRCKKEAKITEVRKKENWWSRQLMIQLESRKLRWREASELDTSACAVIWEAFTL